MATARFCVNLKLARIILRGIIEEYAINITVDGILKRIGSAGYYHKQTVDEQIAFEIRKTYQNKGYYDIEIYLDTAGQAINEK